MSYDYFEQNVHFSDQPISKLRKSSHPAEPNYNYRIQNPPFPVIDKSDWFASLTSLNGCLNGSTGPMNVTSDPKTMRYEMEMTRDLGKPTWISHGFQRLTQILVILDNLNSEGWTSHKNAEIIQKKIILNYLEKKESILQLGVQNNYLLPAGYSETWGLGRNKNEPLLKYIKRVWNDPIVRNSNCWGMREMIPSVMEHMNCEIQTFPNTYYFSMATGERKRNREKNREIFKEPSNCYLSAIGFDPGVSENIKFRNTAKKLSCRSEAINLFELISMYLKIALNILSLNQKGQSDNHHDKSLKIPRLDNRLNPGMNNLTNFDFAIRDWIDDTDLVLARISAEFPRASAAYTNKK